MRGRFTTFNQLEYIAKVLAYRDLKVGQVIGSYQVTQVFSLSKNVPAFGLHSHGQNPSILLFRGTDIRWKGRHSIWADFDLKGPGVSLYLKAQPHIREWIEGENVIAMGYSLGSALATYAALFENIPAFAFNGPGLYRSLYKQWEALPQKPDLTQFITEGDPVSKVGHLVGDIKRFAFPEKLKPIEAHTVPYFSIALL